LNPGLQSQLKGSTFIDSFSRALLIDGTTVAGALACGSAGDAWKDAGVTGTITGCEHAPPPDRNRYSFIPCGSHGGWLHLRSHPS
jgi:hypothetical protein